MTRLELTKKRAKELEKNQSNVTNKENTQSTSNTSKTNKRLELAKQRATEVENKYKKAQEQQQAWNDYVSKNGVDKINSDYSKYMKSVNNTLAPKLSQTDSMQNILANKNVITPQEIKKAKEEENKSALDKFYDNVVEPSNQFHSSLFYNTGKPFVKAIYKTGKTVDNAIKGEEHPFQKAQEQTDTVFSNFEKAVGYDTTNKNEKVQKANMAGNVIGNIAGYIGGGMALGGGALGYGAVSGATAFGNTNDVGDIAFETGTGAMFGAISSATNNAVIKGIEKVFPATNPLTGTAVKTGALALKNAIAGGTGTYTATATTGELRNAYNKLRGREVTKEDWIKPVWSTETAVSTLVGAGLGAYSGTKTDLKVRAKYERDVNTLVKELEVYANKFNEAIQNGDQEVALDIVRASRDKLVQFSLNKYGNRTVDSKVMNEVANKWRTYLENTTAYYNFVYNDMNANVNGQGKLGNPTLENLKNKYNTNTVVPSSQTLREKYSMPVVQKQFKVLSSTLNNTQNQLNNAQVSTDNAQNTSKSFQNIIKNNSTIQGLEDYSEQDIKNIVSDYVENLDSDVKIKNVKLNSNQENGLNATIEYDGNISQEELTDILNQEPLTIDGVKININAEDLNVFEGNKEYNRDKVYSFPDNFVKNDFIEKEFNNQETALSDFTKREIIERVVDDIENYVQNKGKITHVDLDKYIEHLDNNAPPNAELERYYREDSVEENFNAWKEAKKIYKNTMESALKELGYEYDNEKNAFVKHYELPKTEDEVEANVKSRITSEIEKDMKIFVDNNFRDYERVDGNIVDDYVDELIKKIYTPEELEELEDFGFETEIFNATYEKVEDFIYEKGYAFKDNDYGNDPHFEPDISLLENSDEIRMVYNRLPSTDFEFAQLDKIRDEIQDLVWNIEKTLPNNIDITYNESGASADATYIKLYNEDINETYEIRIGNHFKWGTSGNADENISISDYSTITDLKKAVKVAIEDGLSNLEVENVDIIEESDYNEYNTKERTNKIYSKISDNERAQVASEVLQWRQDEANGIHYIDLSTHGYKSYIYSKTGKDIETLLRIDGTEDFRNYIRKGVEDGTYKKSTSLDGWIANIKSEYRRHSNDNDVLSNGRNSKTNDRTHIKSIRQQRRNNNGEITTKSSRNELIENSEQSSFSLPKTDNQGRTLTKEQQEYFKDSKVRDEERNLLTLYHGTNEEFTIFERNKISKNTKNAGWYGDGFYFTRDRETANRYTRTGKIKEIYLNLKNPFNIENIQALSEYRYIKNLVDLNPEWGNIYTNWMERNTWRDITEDYEELSKQGYDTSQIDEILFEKYGEIPGREGNNVLDRLYYESVKNNYKILSQVLKDKGYDGIVSDSQNDEYTVYVAFDSNQIKSVDNTTPTTDVDITKEPTNSYDSQTAIEKLEEWNANRKEVYKELAKRFGGGANYWEANIDDFTQEQAMKFLGDNWNVLKKFAEERNIKIDNSYDTKKHIVNSKEFGNYIKKIIEPLYSKKPKITIEELTEFAQDTFGTTDDFSFGAYMTPDGELLDFEDGGFRDDHRGIASIYYKMNEFINAGNIRMQPEASGFEIAVEPTEKQYSKLSEYIDYYLNDEIYVDISNESGNVVASNDYPKGTSSKKVLNDIRYYFKNGKFPTKSEYADFLNEQSTQYDNQITIEDTLRTKMYYKSTGNKPVVVAQRYWNGFEKKGYIDLNGKTVRDAQDVAELSQIFRNPQYETARMIYVKGNTIVGQEAVSSHLPNSSAVFTDKNKSKAFYKIEDRMKRLNADGYYMVHNHPSGVAKASQQDINVTKTVSNNVKGFKGHIIVNHGTYAYISKGLDGDITYKNELKVDDKNALYKGSTFETALPTDKIPWSERIDSREDFASLMYNLKNSPNYSSLILSDSNNKINAIIDVPNGFFNMRTNHVEGYIRNVAKQYGATKAFIGTSNSEVFDRLKQLSILQDVILYKDNQKQFADKGNKIFETNNRSVAVRTAEETKDERIERVRKYIEEFQQGMGTLGVKVNRKEIIKKIIDNYGITTKGNSKELDKVSTEIQKLLEDGALTDKKIEGYAEYLIDNLKVTVDDFYSANKELKELIRNTKLYASDTVKNGFGDWADFRKRNIGILRLTNDENALPIDTFYKELTEIYGETFFPSDIANISDQLERISEVAKQIKIIDQTLRENIKDNFGEEAIQEIQDGLVQNLKTWRDKMAQKNPENTDEKPDEIKQRSWTETAKNNEMLDKFLDIKNMNYVVSRNIKAVEKANSILELDGYEKALSYFESVIESHKIPTPSDMVLGERLIQEATKRGEFEKAMELVSDVTILGTELGQPVQAMGVISRLSPAGQLMHLKRSVERINKETRGKGRQRNKNKRTQGVQGTINEFAEIVTNDENKVPKEIRDNSKLKNIVDKIIDGKQAKMELPQEITDNEEFKTAMNEIVTGKTNDNSKLKSIVEKWSDEIVTGEQTKTDLPKETRDNSKLENISNEIVNGSQEKVDLPRNEYDNSKLMELVDKVVDGEQSKIEFKQEINDNKKLKKIVTEVVEGEQGKLDLGATDEALDAVEKFKGLEITPEMEMEILSAKTPEELKMAMTRVKEQLASQMPVGWTEKLSSWRYLSMLGNPGTHIKNILGNLVMTTTLYQGKNFIQRAVETVFDSKLEERTRTFKKSTDEVKYFAKKMLEENVETLTGSGYANIQSEIKDMRKIFKIGLLNKISELNSNALSKEDFWFKAPIFKSALAEYLTANGIKTEQDIKQNKEVVQKGISFAIDEALKATFNQYNKLASAISRLENNSALGRVFVGGLAPFKKTTLNIVKTSWQYSPLGLLETVTLQTHNLRNGLINANEYIERISQGLTGSAVTLVGMWLASMGLLTGSSGSGKEDEYKESLGMFAPYSIHLPEGEIFGIHFDEKFVDISWLAPSAVPLLVGVEIYDAIVNNKEKDVFKTVDDIIKILEKTMNPISNMTMLSTFNDALINYGGNDDTSGLEAILSTVIKSYIGQFFPTLGYRINKIIDPTIRSTKASKNSSFKKGEQIVRQNANKIPFTSLLLEPSTDIWGNVRKRSDNFVVRAVDSLFNPASVEKPSSTGVDEKILKLYEANKNNKILPSIPGDSFTVNSETYEMSASEYTQYKMTYGQTAYKKLKTLFSTSEYRQMSNEEKEKAIAEVYEMSKKLAQYEYMTAKYGKNKAMSKLLDDKELKKYNEAKKLGLNYEKYLEAYYSQKSVEGDKNKKGETIYNSEKKNKIEAIQKALNTTKEKAEKLQSIFAGKYKGES